MLVLLADDDDELRYILARVLRKEGYDVEEISDIDALSRRLSRYDRSNEGKHRRMVLVTDVYMPGGNAIDAVGAIKHKLEKLPFIFITSAKDAEVTRKGLALGADAVLSKPVDMDHLKQLLRRIFEG